MSGSAHAGSTGREGGAVRARRELVAALGTAALGAALVLFASSQAWADVTWQRHPSLPPSLIAVSGGEAAPLAPAAALVLLAAAGALLAVRGIGRVLVGLVMVLAGAGAAWSSGRALGDVDVFMYRLSAVGVPDQDVTRDLAPAWPVVAVMGGVLGIVAGLLTAARGRRWPAMGRRYERPGGPAAPPAAPATGEQRAHSAWAALDRGEDPTEDPTEDPVNRPPGGPVR